MIGTNTWATAVGAEHLELQAEICEGQCRGDDALALAEISDDDLEF